MLPGAARYRFSTCVLLCCSLSELLRYYHSFVPRRQNKKAVRISLFIAATYVSCNNPGKVFLACRCRAEEAFLAALDFTR